MMTAVQMRISCREIELQPRVVVYVVNQLRHAWIDKGGGEHGMRVIFDPIGPEHTVIFEIHPSKRGSAYASHN